MRTQTIILAIFVFMLTFGISSAEIYKWVDENGVTHYSDSPTRVMAEATETHEIQFREPAANKNTNSPALEKANTAALDSDFFDFLEDSQEKAVTAKAPTVEIYETSWCVYCKKAKNFFRSRGIKFSAYDIEKDPQAARRMKTMTDRRAVPYVVINGKGIQGYSEQAYTLALQN